MRASRQIFWNYLNGKNIYNVTDVLVMYEGALVSVENLPESFIKDRFGCGRDELYEILLDTSMMEDVYGSIG